MLDTCGDVLECGSGVTSLTMGILADQQGRRITSLEHNGEWQEHVQQVLWRCGVQSVSVLHAPLKAYDAFDWYDVECCRDAGPFSLVVCDGPPSRTRGGRYGLLPLMRGRLHPDCIILLDDASRNGEQGVIRLWQRIIPLRVAAKGLLGLHAEIGFA
jgi:predicted O-methyltransferase YrrM